MLTNTGEREGTEVVQLYLKDTTASMTRPVMELQGFARVNLGPTESREVKFQLNPSMMAFLDENMRWKIEKGEIKVLIGASSSDIRLEDSFVITKDLWIEGRNRKLFADVHIV